MAFDHAVGPGVAGLREFVFDAKFSTDRIKGMGLFCFPPKTSVRKFGAIVGQRGVRLERRNGGNFSQEVRRVDGGFSRYDFDVTPARVSLDGNEHLPIHAADFDQIRGVDMHVAQRRGRKLLRLFFDSWTAVDRQLVFAQKP